MAGDGGAAAFKARLKAVMPTIEAEINTKYRKLVWRIFADLVNNSPQWSGNLASNWRVNAGGYSQISGYNPQSWYREDPYERGDDPAVSLTMLREFSKVEAITYLKPVRIFNPTPYASEVEVGQGPDGRDIREVNKLAEYGAVAMIGYVNQKYNLLGGKNNI